MLGMFNDGEAKTIAREELNMDDLRAKLPELNLANVSSAAWIRSTAF